MRILHTSDWHLGAMDGETSLLEDQKYFIDGICSIAAANSVDAVIIAGDVYDKSIASAEAIRLYSYAMTRLCSELKIPVLVIAGNHDSAERLSSCSDLLSSAGLHISGALEREIAKVSFADTDIYLLPWITEAKVKSVFPERKDEIASLEDAYRVVTEHIRGDFDSGKRHIIASHAFITDSETSTSDRAAEIGSASQVPASIFDGFDYVALGHIHKPQRVSGNIRYSGTPMPYSFGKEEKQEKGVVIVDTGDMSQTVVPLPLLHTRTTLTGTLDELLDYAGPEETRNGYVRLRITDQYVGLEALTEFKRVFPNLIDAQGKNFDGGNSEKQLTIEELENLEANPVEIFRHFCREEMNTEPDEHLTKMFENAMKSAEEKE